MNYFNGSFISYSLYLQDRKKIDDEPVHFNKDECTCNTQ